MQGNNLPKASLSQCRGNASDAGAARNAGDACDVGFAGDAFDAVMLAMCVMLINAAWCGSDGR